MDVISDKRVGELWRRVHEVRQFQTSYSEVLDGWLDEVEALIRKLVEERAELSYRRQGGRWAFAALTIKERQEWKVRALRDFGIDRETWEGSR